MSMSLIYLKYLPLEVKQKTILKLSNYSQFNVDHNKKIKRCGMIANETTKIKASKGHCTTFYIEFNS